MSLLTAILTLEIAGRTETTGSSSMTNCGPGFYLLRICQTVFALVSKMSFLIYFRLVVRFEHSVVTNFAPNLKAVRSAAIFGKFGDWLSFFAFGTSPDCVFHIVHAIIIPAPRR